MNTHSLMALVAGMTLTSLSAAQAPATLTITGDTVGSGAGFADPAMANVQAGQPLTFSCQVGIIPQPNASGLALYPLEDGTVSLDIGLAVSVSGVTVTSASIFGMEDSFGGVTDRVGLSAAFPAGYDLLAVGDDTTGAWLSSDLMTQNGSFSFSPTPPLPGQFRIQEPASGGFIGLTNLTITLAVQPQLGAAYCATVANSTGNAGGLAVAGSPVAAANDFLMLMHDLPPQMFGMALASQTQGNFANPLGQGNICLAGTIGRFNQPGQLRMTDTSGFTSFQVNLNAIPQGSGLASVMSGETWNVQFWHRDVVGGVQSSNLTNAVSVPFL